MRIVGTYLCYRRYWDDRLWIRRVNFAEDEQPNDTRVILLTSLLTSKSMIRQIAFKHIHPASMLSIRQYGKEAGIAFNEQLLQVMVGINSYVFDLS